MPSYIIKGKHFSKEHIWFETFDSADSITSKCDYCIIYANFCDLASGKWRISEKQYSLSTDLTQSMDSLYKEMSKTVRNEINRCEREKVKVRNYTSAEILSNPGIIKEFSAVYHNMYAEKGMANIFLNTDELLTYAQSNALLITVAAIGGQDVVFHSYIIDKTHSRFLQSCSEFRISDNGMRNSIGRANKFLHWNDFKLLKNKGIKVYDWGGIHSLKNPNGIDKFKMAFGGTNVEYYNITCICSLRARLFSELYKIKKELKKCALAKRRS